MMRWQQKTNTIRKFKLKKQPPREGDTRIKTSFLLLPRTICYEYRWLEKASWKQLYCRTCSYEKPHWLDIRWVNKGE